MITPPAGWVIERTEDGVLVCPPEGPQRAVVRYAERVRPIRRAIQLVREAAVPAGFTQTAIGAPRRLVTAEGEHAALVARAGTIGDRAVELVHAFVFLDDYYAALEGIAHASAGLAAIVEQLAVGDLHLLGRERRRRYVYMPPPGWQGTGNVLEAR